MIDICHVPFFVEKYIINMHLWRNLKLGAE